MNQNADFTDIRSILHYCNENIEQLDKLSTVCGFQSVFKDIADRLQSCLRSKSYLNLDLQPDPSHLQPLRRIVFYLMLNTRTTFPSPYNIDNDNNVVHLLSATPQLTGLLFFHLMWQLRLQRFLCDAIALTPPPFAVAHLNANLIESLRSSTVPELNYASRIQPLIVAIFQNAVTIDPNQCHHHLATLRRFGDIVQELVREFMTITPELLNNMTNSGGPARLLGYTMKYALQAVRDCIGMFVDRSRQIGVSPEAVAVFGILDDGLESTNTADSQHKQQHDAILLRMITVQLNAIQSTAKLINFRVYLAWADWDLDEEFTMQRRIGESAHALVALIAADERLRHDVAAQLEPLAQRPQTLAEVMRNASFGECMAKLDSLDIDADVRRQWLDEFMSRGTLVFDNGECVDTLEGNVQYMHMDNIRTMMRAIAGEFGPLTDDDCADRLRGFVVQAASHRSGGEVLQLVGDSLVMCPPHGIDLELDTFGVAAIALFNRCTPAMLNGKDTALLFLQSPAAFVDHALRAALSTDQLLEWIGTFLGTLRPHGGRFVQRTLLAQMETAEEALTDAEMQRFGAFIQRHTMRQFETPREYHQFVFECVRRSTAAAHNRSVRMLLQVLLQAVAGKEFADCRTTTGVHVAMPLLLMCANVLDKYRWELTTFGQLRAAIVADTVDLVHALRKVYLPVANGEERRLLVENCAGYGELTRFYYQRFGLERSEMPVEFAVFVCRSVDVATAGGEELMNALLLAIVRCTRKEMSMLAQCAAFRPYWFLALSLLGRVIVKSQPQEVEGNSCSWKCMRHVASGLAHIVRTTFQPAATTITSRWLLISDYFKLIRRWETLPIYADLFMDAHYAIVELVGGVQKMFDDNNGGNIAENVGSGPTAGGTFAEQCAVFRKVVSELKDCPAKMLVLAKL